MIINFIKYLISFVYIPTLRITESPTSYFERTFPEHPDATNILFYQDDALYYNVTPHNPSYSAFVEYDMRDITIDNNIAKIKYLFFDYNEPIWPKFTGHQPKKQGVTPYNLYLL